jgi:hypothetical protein
VVSDQRRRRTASKPGTPWAKSTAKADAMTAAIVYTEELANEAVVGCGEDREPWLKSGEFEFVAVDLRRARSLFPGQPEDTPKIYDIEIENLLFCIRNVDGRPYVHLAPYPIHVRDEDGHTIFCRGL